MNDTNCPYSNAEIEINHDEGYGYEEDELHQQECDDCEKTFVYSTSILYYYNTIKADCLNGGDHKWKQTTTYPKQWTKMRCMRCDKKRDPTDEEWKEIMK